MQKKDCYYLGTITKAIGYKGELSLFLDTDEPEAYKKLESIFIEQNGLLVPFFLKQVKPFKEKHLKILLEDTDQPNALIGSEVYLPLSTLPVLEGNKFYYHEVIGFTALDKGDTIGEIEEVRETKAQDLFVVKHKTAEDTFVEVLIPVSDVFIEKVDRQTQSVQFDLPEGFIEVFLD